MCDDTSRAVSLRNGGFVGDDFVQLKHGSDTHRLAAIPGALVYPNDFSGCPDEHFGGAGDFGGKSYREIQLDASVEFAVDGEIDALNGDVPGLANPGTASFSTCRRTLTGSDKSYRRAVRRSFIRVAASDSGARSD